MALLFIFIILLSISPTFARAPASWRQKVDPALLNSLTETEGQMAVNPAPQAEFLILMATQADLRLAAAQPTKLAKGQYVYATATAVARESQAALLAQLQAAGIPHRSFWIVNMVWAEGDLALVQELAMRADVAYVYANPPIQMALPVIGDETVAGTNAVEGIEWNIDLIGAPLAWVLGFTGAGVVIGGQDTGYEWEHPALKQSYRGWDAASGTADHDFNWHDTVTSGTNTYCTYPSPAPCDDFSSSHGTHTMGTMVGNELDQAQPDWPAGAVNAVGVAPGAEWIGCRNMKNGVGTADSYTECYEWFIAPYPLGGDPLLDGDPARAPHVINNSWSCPPSETGCHVPDVMEVVVGTVRAAGIVSVHAAGNEGTLGPCNTVLYPAATYDESFSVGATDQPGYHCLLQQPRTVCF